MLSRIMAYWVGRNKIIVNVLVKGEQLMSGKGDRDIEGSVKSPSRVVYKHKFSAFNAYSISIMKEPVRYPYLCTNSSVYSPFSRFNGIVYTCGPEADTHSS